MSSRCSVSLPGVAEAAPQSRQPQPDSPSPLSTAASAASSTAGTPAASGKKKHKKKSSKAKRSHSIKIREAAALETYLHRAQLFQSTDARQQERQNLLLRKSGSSQFVALPGRLPPVVGVPSSPSTSARVVMPKESAHRAAPQQRLCGFLASADTGINTLLSVLKLDANDTFFDLGCGDGRVVLAVVQQFGCKGVGVDLAGPLISQAQARAKREFADRPELLERVSFIQEDIGKMPLETASAVYIYMPQDAVHTLCSKVLPGTGIRDGTLIFTEEYWLHDRAALRHCKWKASHWDGDLHVYEWQEAHGKKERSTF